MKNKKYNKVVIVQYEKNCSNRVEVCDFVNEIRDKNPDIVFYRKEEIPDTDESVKVRITGWYYGDSSSKPKKKKSNTKE